ncbi:ABC transporter substrate-binding protein [Bifidobacterium boum]|uniref:Dipeptide ABC superfamily ATP binding cassette transporter, binding protein n=1 Tax=Bifidobacterium boum TaxID=78343 RepID=A0A086ZI93_9BIFI|nr:ABC transporter substrate-binding protein [Bifidobacterium boum]KFI46243.1 dipeptide ABC superfamily ATP binding cassette transporter, binding protein [Bifidobacterium boum]
MVQSNGAHGESDATEADTTIQAGAASGASTDASLNARVKQPDSGHHKPVIWMIAALIVVALIACIVVVNSRSRKTATPTQSDSVAIGIKLAPVSLDIRNQSGSALEQLLIGNVYEALVSRNSNNEVEPGLAKSWTISNDGLTYTFKLNEHMNFSNGDTLDATDVAWSINQLKSKQYYNSDQVENLKQASASDATTVKLTLSRPDANMLWYLSGRPGLVFDKDAHYDAKTTAVGSGPYMVKSFDSSSKLVLQANPKYWGSAHKARTTTVTVRFLPDDNAALNALTSGDVQVLSPVNANMTGKLKSSGKYTVKATEGSDKFVLAFNCTGAKTADKRVRQAIRYAINHKEIIASRGGVDAALGGPIPSVDPGYEDLTGLYPYNPAKAKSLMQQAGYSTNHPLKLTLTYANVYGSELGEQLRSQLSHIGIDLNVNTVEFSTWLQDVHTNGDYDLSLVDHAESHDFYKWTQPDYYYHYDNAQVQALYAKALAATDEQDSAQYLKQAARIVSEDAPADWLFAYRVSVAQAKGVTGFPSRLTQSVLPLWKVAYTPAKA